MSERFTPKDLERLGYVDNGDGSYTKKVPSIIPEKHKGQMSVLTIEGIVHGLNGSKGLMRSHWSSNAKVKKLYSMIIKNHLQEGKVRKHEGKVSVRYIGYKSVLSDWDNFGSSGKHIFDSLVKAGVLKDDSPKVITEFKMEQIKCKRIEQKVIVIITDIE